jgi:integrase
VSDIRFTAVQAWVSQFAIKRGPVVVQTAYSVLARILDDAVQDGLLASNPARNAKLPKRPPRRNVYLTANQLDKLADESGRYRSLVLLLGVGGLRWGEAAALRVGDVDFLRRRIELHRNAVQVGTKIIVGTLKGNKNRWVVLPEFVIDALAETAKGKGRDDLLWPSGVGRLHRATRVKGVLAVRGRGPAPESRPDVSAGHRSRPAAHGRVAGDQRRGESKGGPADAGPRERRDDAGRVRRFVRLRPHVCCGECGQNVGTAGAGARAFDT